MKSLLSMRFRGNISHESVAADQRCIDKSKVSVNIIELSMNNVEKKLPNLCPSCGHTLTVRRFGCDSCDTTVEGVFGLPVLARLSAEDQALVVGLIKASGSLKDLARQYGVSYPTIRNRLDDLITQVESMETEVNKGGKL